MAKVLSTTIMKYRVDTVVVLLDHAEAVNGIVKIVGVEAAVARITDQGKIHDQKSMSLLDYLTPKIREDLETSLSALIAPMKQAEDVG